MSSSASCKTSHPTSFLLTDAQFKGPEWWWSCQNIVEEEVLGPVCQSLHTSPDPNAGLMILHSFRPSGIFLRIVLNTTEKLKICGEVECPRRNVDQDLPSPPKFCRQFV
jgi:hypothetical protein